MVSQKTLQKLTVNASYYDDNDYEVFAKSDGRSDLKLFGRHVLNDVLN